MNLSFTNIGIEVLIRELSKLIKEIQDVTTLFQKEEPLPIVDKNHVFIKDPFKFTFLLFDKNFLK